MTIYRRAKTFRAFLFAFLLILLLFIVISIISIIQKDYYKLVIMAFFFVFIGGMFLMIALIEYHSYLELDHERIIFHYKVFSSDLWLRWFNRKGLIVEWKDVKLVKLRKTYGDKILTKDSVFITFFLNDSRIFETTFFHFGNENEKEIIKKIKSCLPPSRFIGDI